MMRKFHSIPGLLAALLISLVALTGSFLALQPALEMASAPTSSQHNVSVAELVHRIDANQSGVLQIKRKASGKILARGMDETGPWARQIDPITGLSLGGHTPSTTFVFVMDLHRSFLQGNTGRLASGASAAFLVLLCVSGALMLGRRFGGWRKILSPAKGSKSGIWHINIARFTLLGLLVSSISGTYMSLVSFGVVADGSNNEAQFPMELSGNPPSPLNSLVALQQISIHDLRELTFPMEGDLQDAFAITTKRGTGYIDQSNGMMLTFAPRNVSQSIYETIYMLHTGEGVGWISALFALLFGLSALGLPILSISGAMIWWKRRSNQSAIKQNSPIENADICILFGSEGESTKGFAVSLHKAITALAKKAHIAPMNQAKQQHFDAEHTIILTSTYGDGAAPASASHFMQRLETLKPNHHCNVSVLGFGDRKFPNFCAFANQVQDALYEMGFSSSLPITNIHCQCPQSFKQWSISLGETLDLPLSVDHRTRRQMTMQLVLQSKEAGVSDTPSELAIFRFSTSAPSKCRVFGELFLPQTKFDVGDLVGILPPREATPRFYSLASSSQDGFLEICVKRHSHGVCSNYLHELEEGDSIECFIKPNSEFRPAAGVKPVILIGAGTGIAPLAGFARQNTTERPMLMYWGGRHQRKDFIYQEAMNSCLQSRRLSRLVTAFSAESDRAYVQDRVQEEAPLVRSLIANDAQILVCGGRPMATGLQDTLNDILKPLGINVDMLKQQRRYLEDVY